ncbi:MAG: tRNA pseudouridine(55) synthase TruB [Chloroflexi bacterium]|nr:tRNA pseudouridine(55) synthase TruB [Chloroflexota bacterium]
MDEANGIISVIKPLQWTSMEVVRRIKRLTQQKKVGHAGTLDPQATGVLPICLGQATKVMEYLVDSPKIYSALIHLGVSTDSYDALGHITDTSDPSHITEQDVSAELEKYQGVFHQVPPMFSALKKDGERLYNLARAGKEVTRSPREVEIYRLKITQWNPPEVRLELECGRGMYVRSLAHDLGTDLGCGAHLKELTRLRSGPFHISAAASMEQIERACQDGSWRSLLFPVDFPLHKFKAAIVQKDKENAIRQGQGIYLGLPSRSAATNDLYRLYSVDGDFLALLHPGKVRGLWQAQKIFKLRPQPP